MTDDLIHEGGHKYPEGKNRNLVASVLINDIDRLVFKGEKYISNDDFSFGYSKGFIDGLITAKSIIEHREKERKEK
jgi:hypothetical protein